MKYILIPLLILYACCNHPAPPQTTVVETTDSQQLYPQDFIICPDGMLELAADSIPADLFAPKNERTFCNGWYLPDDTITPKGNYVKYLISNDTCCRDNVYLEWGNTRFKQLENFQSYRQMHSKVLPRYRYENDQYLFMESAASSGLPVVGWYLWLFPLTLTPEKNLESYYMISPDAWDIQSMTLLREVESNPTDCYALEAYNIRTGRIKPIKFKNRFRTYPDVPYWHIDSISVTPKSIFLHIQANNNSDGVVNETVFLPNDIK